MNILCVICRDHLISSDDISFTRCGHVFHFNCLSRWLLRSNSCPQCREKISQNIRKLYITLSNNETNSDNNTDKFTQETIENLKFQVLLNEENVKYYVTKNTNLQKQNANLRQEVLKVEREINEKNNTIYNLRQETELFKQKCLKYEYLKYEIFQSQKEIKELRDDISKYECETKLLPNQTQNTQHCFTKFMELTNTSLEEQSKTLDIEEHITNKTSLIENKDKKCHSEKELPQTVLNKTLKFKKSKSQRKWTFSMDNSSTDTPNLKIICRQERKLKQRMQMLKKGKLIKKQLDNIHDEITELMKRNESEI